ncbi:MAG: hypothetical protein U9P73_09220 [Candidatus Cloacimonadota bacterium]|nr:hypothetical protein [Candidatus Cloacimonadota bacterium]
MRKIVVLILFFLCISMVLLGEVFSIYGPFTNLKRYNPEIIDAKAEALGKSSILSSSGANFIFNNPAMLSILSQKTIRVNCRANYGKDTSDLSGDLLEYEYPINLRFNGISFGMPFNIPNNKVLKFSIGAGYRTYYDLSSNQHIEDKNSNFEIDIIYRGGFGNIVLGGGISYQDKLLIGFSASLPFLCNYSTEYNDIDNNEIKTEGTMKGTFFTLSGSYIFTDKITLGARFRTGFTLKWIDTIDDDEVDLIVPPEFGLALEINPKSSLKFYVEYVTRNLSYYEIESNANNYKLYVDLNNGYSIRSGFETGMNTIFRGGFYLQSVPIYEIKDFMGDEVIHDEKPKTEIGFTTGLGIKVNTSVSIDFYGVYNFLKYDESYDSWYSGYNENVFSISQMKIGCSIGYEF